MRNRFVLAASAVAALAGAVSATVTLALAGHVHVGLAHETQAAINALAPPPDGPEIAPARDSGYKDDD